MENKKVYCKNCKYCVKKSGAYIFPDTYICINKQNKIDTPLEPIAPSIEKVNKNNNCTLYTECIISEFFNE